MYFCIFQTDLNSKRVFANSPGDHTKDFKNGA